MSNCISHIWLKHSFAYKNIHIINFLIKLKNTILTDMIYNWFYHNHFQILLITCQQPLHNLYLTFFLAKFVVFPTEWTQSVFFFSIKHIYRNGNIKIISSSWIHLTLADESYAFLCLNRLFILTNPYFLTFPTHSTFHIPRCDIILSNNIITVSYKTYDCMSILPLQLVVLCHDC